jgi:predicted nucleic acid-binding Zn ribbon protein
LIVTNAPERHLIICNHALKHDKRVCNLKAYITKIQNQESAMGASFVISGSGLSRAVKARALNTGQSGHH